MPFKSRAQRRKFAELLVNGKITDEAYERWNRETGRKELPERIHPKPVSKGKARPASRSGRVKASARKARSRKRAR